MRGRVAILLGGLGVAGAFVARALRRSRAAETRVEPTDSRADELRRKLDESRALVEERDEFEEAELPVDRAEPADPDARRSRVHEEGRAAAERMRGSNAAE